MDTPTMHPCPACAGPLILYRSTRKKVCQDCRTTHDWDLKDGQLPLLGNNRQVAHDKDTPMAEVPEQLVINGKTYARVSSLSDIEMFRLLALRRKARCWTLLEVKRATGLAVGVVHRAESDAGYRLRADHLVRLCTAYNISPRQMAHSVLLQYPV